MTATITRAGRHIKPKKLRLASMEVLGFIDTPASTSTTRPVTSTQVAPPAAVLPASITDTSPDEFGARYSRDDRRWGHVVLVGFLAGALAATAFYVYNRPQQAARQVMDDLRAQTAVVIPALVELEDQVTGLLEPGSDAGAIGQALLALDTETRMVFELATALGPDEQDLEARIVRTTSQLMAAYRELGEVVAQRAAVLPILASPDLETDPSLVVIEDAAAAFADWQTGFETVRSALSEGSPVAAAMGLVAAGLEPIQRDYLDALAADDAAGAQAAVDSLLSGLAQVESALSDLVSSTQAELGSLLNRARTDLASLTG